MAGTIIFNLIIAPLEFLFEFVFTAAYRIFDNPLIVIIFLSLVVNFLALPLYKRADAIRREENLKQAKMAPWVKHIKKTFKGDERYMMLTAYYRQENYKTIHSLRGSISLLLQIPFFIAAYHFLSNLELLKGAAFWIFSDLGSPDGLLRIGTLNINVLPVIMTLFNIISAYIYLKKAPMGQKIQTYALAAVFLVLLYASPAGLVLYWTCNQIFSLVKNIIMTRAGKAAIAEEEYKYSEEAAARAKVKYKYAGEKSIYEKEKGRYAKEKNAGKTGNRAPDKKAFILIALFLSLFLGAAIPLSVISSSPAEFISYDNTPLKIVISNFCVMAGVFLIWCGVYYYLGTPKMKKAFTYVLFAIAVVSAADFFFFSKGHGVLSASLVYDKGLKFGNTELFVNLAVIVIVAAAVVLAARAFSKYLRYAAAVFCMAALGFMVTHGVITASGLSIEDFQSRIAVNDIKPVFKMSRTGKNVAVIMLDRAISAYVPFIFDEVSQLKEDYKDFVYYPNMLAYAGHTNFAAPSIFGGYEYTPAAINQRPEESLKDKHDEALKMMPKLLGEQGCKVTIFDPPYAGYLQTSDISIYDGMENVEVRKMIGKYECEGIESVYKATEKIQDRNFVYYSFMKAAPVCLQKFIYDDGNYFSKVENYYSSDVFIDNYAILKNLPLLSEAEDDEENTFLMMDNEITHSSTMLTEGYEPGAVPKNSVYDRPEKEELGGRIMKMDTWSRIASYEVNAAAFIQLAKWFDWLKENGLWDNTRIIILSDHGYSWEQFDDLLINDSIDLERYNALLMVKDFGSEKNALETNNDFMTTADIPALALKGFVEDPVNPYTNKPITDEEKHKNAQLITTSKHYRPNTDNPNGYTFDTSDGEWWRVKDNIFDADNWEFAGYGS